LENRGRSREKAAPTPHREGTILRNIIHRIPEAAKDAVTLILILAGLYSCLLLIFGLMP
jgi:hypothetical protein